MEHQDIATLIPDFPKTLKRLHILGTGGDDPTGVCHVILQHLAWFATIVTPLEELSITASGNAAEEFFEPLPILT